MSIIRRVLIALLFAPVTLVAQQNLAGTEKGIGLKYAVTDDGQNIVEVTLEVFESGLKIRGVFDYSKDSTIIRALIGQKLTGADLEKFTALSQKLPGSTSRAGDTLQAFLALVVDGFSAGEEPYLDIPATREQG